MCVCPWGQGEEAEEGGETVSVSLALGQQLELHNGEFSSLDLQLLWVYTGLKRPTLVWG